MEDKESKATPSEPEKPDEPEKPATPSEPDKPTTPDEPTTPDKPTTPDTPNTPDTPSNPSKPSGGHSHSSRRRRRRKQFTYGCHRLSYLSCLQTGYYHKSGTSGARADHYEKRRCCGVMDINH